MNKNNFQILPIIASVGIGAAAYSLMTGRGGQLQNMMPQLTGMSSQGANNQFSAQQDQNQ
jgi:ABC-type Fe3+ transport system permease subunit